MRILIVEDDVALGPLLQRGMRLEGNETELIAEGESAIRWALEHRPDLMLLDLNLPRKDGVQVLEELNGRIPMTSIIVISARNTVQERIKCLNLGADDYLLKPFSLQELSARCKALTRRRDQFADPTLRHGELELNRIERKVTCDGRRVELTAREFSLLEFLMQARGRCCSRTELLREVWQMSPDAGTNVVDVYVNYLRRKLGSAASDEPSHGLGLDAQFIETVRGAGYMLSATSGRRPVQPVSSVSEFAYRGVAHV